MLLHLVNCELNCSVLPCFPHDDLVLYHPDHNSSEQWRFLMHWMSQTTRLQTHLPLCNYISFYNKFPITNISLVTAKKAACSSFNGMLPIVSWGWVCGFQLAEALFGRLWNIWKWRIAGDNEIMNQLIVGMKIIPWPYFCQTLFSLSADISGSRLSVLPH